MAIEQARDFIRSNHRGILLTSRRVGSPQMSPIVANVDAEGYIVVSSRATAYKVKNLERNPRTSLCMFTDRFYGQWFQVDGVAEIIRLPEAMEPLVDYYRSLSGEHPDWAEYREAMQREERVIIRITAEHAGPTRHG